MINLIFGIIITVLSIFMIVKAKSISSKPNAKIKSTGTVRVCGIIILIIGLLSILEGIGLLNGIIISVTF